MACTKKLVFFLITSFNLGYQKWLNITPKLVIYLMVHTSLPTYVQEIKLDKLCAQYRVHSSFLMQSTVILPSKPAQQGKTCDQGCTITILCPYSSSLTHTHRIHCIYLDSSSHVRYPLKCHEHKSLLKNLILGWAFKPKLT